MPLRGGSNNLSSFRQAKKTLGTEGVPLFLSTACVVNLARQVGPSTFY